MRAVPSDRWCGQLDRYPQCPLRRDLVCRCSFLKDALPIRCEPVKQHDLFLAERNPVLSLELEMLRAGQEGWIAHMLTPVTDFQRALCATDSDFLRGWLTRFRMEGPGAKRRAGLVT